MITTALLWEKALCLGTADANELDRRLAIENFYYSIFLEARGKVGRRHERDPNASHLAVIEDLKRGDASCRRAGNRLDSLRRLRNRARYDIDNTTITMMDLKEARHHADAVCDMLRLIREA
jgi:hypothetical protein